VTIAARRALVIAALFSLSLLLYIDRVCISSAKSAIAGELHLDNAAMGWVFGMFTLGYALFQIPSGIWADRFGPRLTLAIIVTWWSIFTALTGAVSTLGWLLVVRFVFGVGEAGAFPGAARVFFNWLAPGQRGFANGLMFSGSRIGGAVAFLLLPGMIGGLGWRGAFFVLGLVGVLWAVVWYVFFRNHPGPAHVAPGAAALESVRPRPEYGRLFRLGRVWLAMLQYLASNFTFFIALSWMLPYLQQRFGLTAAGAGRYAMIPLLFAATSQWLSGYAVDRLYRAGLFAWSRRLPAMIGFAVAAFGVMAVTQATTPGTVIACFTLAVFGADMTLSPSWTYCVDLAGPGSGGISGAMNMAGNIGSFVSSIAFPYLVRITGTSASYFWVAAVLNVIGLICWFNMTPRASGAAAAPNTA
jgi:ACS family glucarate transporter-like MFS transporter